MSMRSLKALPILVLGFLVGVLPALATSRQVTDNGNSWNPSSLTIETGDDVNWNWSGFHNVAFEDGQKSGVPQAGGSYERTFTTTGTFKFRCEQHSTSFSSGMVGTITVNQASTGTTDTGTGTGTGTTPTNTTPTNTTPTTTTPADTTAPAITALKRRSSRTALILTFRSSEDGDVEATIRRRNPGARAFRVVGRRTVAMLAGANRVTLQRASRGLRRGAYRVTLVFIDAAGNERTRTLVFKIA